MPKFWTSFFILESSGTALHKRLCPCPPKKRWKEETLFLNSNKNSPTLLEPSTCLEGAINMVAAWWTQSTEGHLPLLTSASYLFFFFPFSPFFTHCHTHRASSQRRGRSAGGVVDLSNVTDWPRLQNNSYFWGRWKSKNPQLSYIEENKYQLECFLLYFLFLLQVPVAVWTC